MTAANEKEERQIIDAFVLEPDAPNPTSGHLQDLRHQIFRVAEDLRTETNGLVPIAASVDRPQLPRAWNWPGSSILVTALLAFVVAAYLFWPLKPESTVSNLRNVLIKTGASSWIHGVTSIESRFGSSEFETWFSPTERLASFVSEHSIQFTDYNLGVRSSYNPETSTLYRSASNPHSEEFGRAFITALLNDGDLQMAMPFHRVNQVNKSKEFLGELPVVTYRFNVSWRTNPAIGWSTTVIVDAERNVILSWKEVHTNGTVVHTDFDYPLNGPRSIYELGVPVDVEEVESKPFLHDR